MIIGSNTDNKIRFMTPEGEDLPVREIPSDFSKLKYDTMYIIGDYLYRYYGLRNRENRNIVYKPGSISKFGDIITVSNFDNATDTEKSFYNVSNIFIDEEEDDLDAIFTSYQNNYLMNNNLVITNKTKLIDTGNRYIPELKENDDALTRIMKLMIIQMGVVLNNHRDKFDKDYSLDNMRSAINGATVNMTITKFLAWCKLLNLDWEFELEDNGTDDMNPLPHTIRISSDEDLWVDYGEEETGIFKVPLVEGEDPLKRLIKVCIIMKHINIADYRDRGSTPHLLNNMRSALKRTSRMMFPYFVYWCEILGVRFILTLKNPADGRTISADTEYKAEDYMIDISDDDIDDDENYE